MEEIKKILITGANGMLGEALLKELSGFDLFGSSIEDCDINEKDKVRHLICQQQPDLIIHAAAITDVDKCELEPDLAYKVNVAGTQNVVQAAKTIDAAIFYISTDHIFDGTKKTPYKEQDQPNPVNVYGRTKLAGENIIKNIINKHIIIRTSWLFGKRGRGFVDKLLAWTQKNKSLKIVDDKFSTPTYSFDLATAISKIIEKLMNTQELERKNIYGTYHITNEGECSWFEYALKVLELAHIKDVKINPIKSIELKQAAKRPAYSVLDKTHFSNFIGYKLRSWQEALRDYLCTLN